ncbi:MAG: lipopolysaccharide heptosyltransferase II, partial [Candidatus Zixiibacteriota bacterium]
VFNICGKTDIETAGAVLSMARLFAGNDSGLAHLAAAVDIPLVVLSGADDPKETSPLSANKKVIIKDHLDCISCVKNDCPKKNDEFMRCMKEITVSEVFDAIRDKLSSQIT